MEREKDEDAEKAKSKDDDLEEGLEESMDGSDAPAETQPGGGSDDKGKS